MEAFLPALDEALSSTRPRIELIGLMGAARDKRMAVAVKQLVQSHGYEYQPFGDIPAILFSADTLYQNAWDPHSIVGNGNAGDNSLDGFFGRFTMMHFLCWPRTNQHMQYVPISKI